MIIECVYIVGEEKKQLKMSIPFRKIFIEWVIVELSLEPWVWVYQVATLSSVGMEWGIKKRGK